MNVAGLSNLGLPRSAAKADGIAAKPSLKKDSAGASSGAEKKESSSFEGILGRVQDSSPTNDAPVKSDAQAEAPAQSPTEKTESVPVGNAPPVPYGAPTASPIDRALPAGPVTAAGEAATVKSATLISDESTTQLTRHVVWNDFLRKMSDLGVSAEDVLQAFSTLSEKELAQPPEKSVDKLVMALGLDGQQAQLARQYFNDLVHRTKSKSMGEEIIASNQQLSLTSMSQRDMQKRLLQNSLDNMNRDFFMTRSKPGFDPRMQPGQNPATAILNDATGEPRDPRASAMEWAPGGATALMAPVPGLAVPASNGALSPMAGLAPSGPVNPMLSQMQPATAADQKLIEALSEDGGEESPSGAVSAEASGFNPATAYTNPALQARTLSALQTPSTPGPFAVAAKAESATAANASAKGAVALGAVASLVRGSAKNAPQQNSTGDDGAQNGASIPTNSWNEQALNGTRGSKAEFQSQLTQEGAKTASPVAVPELMQQAHLMVRDGGGDMKVTLHPDGLGEVAMRVSVDNGKVSVQMITESDEAKKLIERQIGDLKSGLQANHLQVESIKVDTATNLGRQLDQQYQDAQRHQAQMQWEQFRQDNQGWRRSFFETGTVNPYQGQFQQPTDVKNPSSGARSASMNNSRRLDLVA